MGNKVSAVDIVLLLDNASEKKAIEVSKEANKEKTSELVLGSNALPHISLLMGGLDESSIDEVKNTIAKIALETNILDLQVLSTERPGLTWEWKIEDSFMLTALYKKVVDNCWAKMIYPVTKDAFFGGNINDKTPMWVNAFERQERIGRFSPHVTLSQNEVPQEKPFEIKAVKLALFQLGNYCTCARELASFSFKES